MADNKLNYQQARKVRKAKFSDILLDQLAQKDKGVFSAIGKTISMKTEARVKGIKEKFDPLNIVKFMTMGSRFGPALFGKMTGRNQRDIDYFTGRTKSVVGGRNTAEKLKKVPGEDFGGINSQLSKIYTFLKGSQENELLIKNKSKNFEEELILEKKRRHDELIETLNELVNNIRGGPTTTTMEKVGDNESIFDRVKRMIAAAMDNIKDLINLKEMFKSIPWSKLLTVLRWFAGPVGLALLGITSIVMFAKWLSSFIAENMVNRNVITPEKAVELLKTPGAYREIAQYGGREALLEMAKNGHIKAKEILERGDIREINQAGGIDFLEKVRDRGAIDTSNISPIEDLSQFKPIGPKRPETGGTLLPSKQREWDKKWSKIYNPKTGRRLDLDTVPSLSEQESDNELTRLKNRTPPASSTDVLPNPPVTPPAPVEKVTPMVTPSPVSSLTNNNIDLNMQAADTDNSLKTVVSKTVNNLSQKQQRTGLRPSQISVRNDEPTFMQLIIDSTRVV